MSERYRCRVCGWEPAEDSESRDFEHCPHCLSSIHESDQEEEECGGILEPVSIWVKPDGKMEILQRCRFCGEIHSSPKDEKDNPLKIMSIAARPLAEPPFPLDRIEDLTRMMGGKGNTGGYFHEQGE